jgi:hypothetical protein
MQVNREDDGPRDNEGLPQGSIMPPTSGITEPELANSESPDYYRKMDRRLIVLETRFDTILPTLATKTDLLELKAELKESIGALRTEMRDSDGSLRTEMRDSNGSLRTEMRDSIGALRTELHDFKADIHKWMTATMITMFVGFGSMIVAMLTLLRPG